MQNTADGSLILDTDNHYGFGWNETDSRFGIEAWDDTDGNRNVELKEDVEHSEDDKASTITVGDGRNVNLDLNGSNIEGDGEHDVIDVKKGGELTVKGDEPAAPEALPRTPGSPLTPPTPSSATYPTTAS